MQGCILLSPVPGGDANKDVFVTAFRVFNKDVEVAVVIESSGVVQLEFRLAAAASPVFVDQLTVWEFSLRILVKHPHITMRRRGIEIEVILLGIFSVIAFVSGQSEYAFLQNRIAPVPQRQGEADDLVPVADPGNSILAPAIGSRSGVIVRKKLPGGSARAVVLAHRAPLALGKVRPPTLPILFARAIVFEPNVFSGLQSRHAGTSAGGLDEAVRA